MAKSTISMAIFNSYVSHYQRVNPIHNPIQPPFSYGFPMVFHGFHGFSHGFPVVLSWFSHGFQRLSASQAGAPAASLRPARPFRFDPASADVGGRGGRVAGRAACYGDPGRGLAVGGDKPWENHRKTMGKPWENGGWMGL